MDVKRALPGQQPRDPGWRWGFQVGTKSREQAVETGYKQLGRLAAALEAHTGATLASRRALDYGCGWGRLAVPLAQQCEHVYGVDVSPSVLREAEETAREAKVENVEWVQASRLAELAGRYDLVLSVLVFQHIPARTGEQIFGTLVQGLAPGGVGAINVTLRPSRRLAGSSRAAPSRSDLLGLARGRDSYLRTLRNSYSLNRLGRLLAEAGITEWHISFTAGAGWRSHDAATLLFRKD